ncbi:hypothetical protein FDW83_02900 [Pseudarthrobacter sp. NamE2]|uniref:hypothetical protein n=1 Tax=Pseudarthrobacter sp. NamE2 TaxID=2576838 RepID=UPI0010FDCD75|nr:hypothetical protein [Pseudarthrobacter sp. NamE2]TLM85356.1 hypothetical protein FDW83_02900 [Pseudarthrobacter sp. NamE2]
MQDLPASGIATSSATPPSPASPTPVVDSPTSVQERTYKLTTASGAEISFLLPASATDPAVEAIEAYRVKAGAEPVSYLVADVDNRRGNAPVDMYMVNVFDDQGRQLSFSRVTDVIQSWGPTYSYDFKWTMGDGNPVDEGVGAGLKREATALQNSNLDDAAPGEQTRIVLASADADLPLKVARVTVQPSGMGTEEEARPASWGD